ncbi:hypothetical protein MMC30_007086 [Trapelia coarctata]|nr:hypothetical protein [Trapelia coarctata]
MAKNLQSKIPKSDTLYIYDSNTTATSTFVQEVGSTTEGKGGPVEIAANPREVAEKATTIHLALPSPTHVTSVFDSILSSPLPQSSSPNTQRLFIDHSTIDPSTSRHLAHTVSAISSGHFVDAPMSGGVVGATAGTLTFMLGCPPSSALVDRVTTTLLHMGTRVFHLGAPGAGLAGKLANNYLLAISNIATAEAMNLGLKLGLDAEKLGELINSSSGRCWSSEVNNPVPGVSQGAPAERGYEGGFGVGLMRKDLRLAMEAARDAGARVELGERAGEVYERVEREEGVKDFSVVYKWLGGKT